MSRKNTIIILSSLVLLFLAFRLAMIFTSIDHEFFEEELFRSNIAKELISGPLLPFFDYQRSEYEGGSLVAGLVIVPFFLLFGPTLLACKYAGLLFSTAALLSWILLLYRFFPKRVAIIAGLLWVFSPPFFTRATVFTATNYIEESMFSALALYLFFSILFDRKRIWRFVALGILSGFAVFYHYVFLVTLSAILLFWAFIEKRHFFSKHLAVFSLSFLVGFSPWIYYNAMHGFEGLLVIEKPLFYWFSPMSPGCYLQRFAKLVLVDIAKSFDFRSIYFLDGALIAVPYYLLFIVSFFWIAFMHRGFIFAALRRCFCRKETPLESAALPRELFFIVFIAVYVVILSISRFEFKGYYYLGHGARYRFLLFFYPFMFALLALFFHNLAQIKKPPFMPYLSYCLLGAALLAAASNNLGLISWTNSKRVFLSTIYKGYNYYALGKIMCWRYQDPGGKVELVKGIKNADDRKACLAGMGWGFAKGKFSSNYDYYIKTVLPKIDWRYWPYAYERLGMVIGYNSDLVLRLRSGSGFDPLPYYYRGVGRKEAQNILSVVAGPAELLDIVDAAYGRYLYNGAGVEYFEVLTDDTPRFLAFIRSIDKSAALAVYQGMAEGKEYFQFDYDKYGYGLGKVGYDIGKWNKIIASIDETGKPFCYLRAGIEIGLRLVHDIDLYRNFLSQVDQRYRASIYQGIGRGLGWRFGYDKDNCKKIIRLLDRKYESFLSEGLEEGIRRRERSQ